MNSLMKLRTYSENDNEVEEIAVCREKNCETRLPLPDFLKNSSKKAFPSQEVNAEGKIRNFPHEPGNWATYIYIPVDSSELFNFLNALINFFKPLNLKLVEDFHISLTRTVILKYHWITDFIKSVKTNLKGITSFRIHLFGLKAYINEQNTRSFLSLRVNEREKHLSSIANKLNDSFKDYNLEGFYEDPSFHLSLLWCPGDKFNEINKYIDLLPFKLKNFGFCMDVSQCICATGNKKFTFNFYQSCNT